MLNQLLIIRHGKAIDSHPQGDRHRELSAVGRQRLADLLPQLRDQNFHPDLGLVSPYVRARQTAEVLFGVLAPQRTVETRNLMPDAGQHDVLLELEAWSQGGVTSAVLVSHNPLVSELTHWLVEPARKGEVHFQTPSLWCLEFPSGPKAHEGRVLWVLHP